jgi:hypothetical protein
MIGNRTRRDFKKKAKVAFKMAKGIVEVATFVLPGGKVYKGAKATQKFIQSKRVEKLLKERQQRRAKKIEQGADLTLDGRKLSDVIKKLGVK